MSNVAAVLARVEKLLALSTSSNVHEAALAAARAQELIEAHRLEDLLAARAAARGEGPEPVGEEVLEVAKRPRRWRAILAAALAPSQACLAYSVARGREEELRIAGRAADRAAVRTLFQWLAPRLEWLSASHGAGRSRDWHEAFRVGAAEEVAARLGEPAAAASADSTALLAGDRALRAAAVEEWATANLRLGGGRGLRLDAHGYTSGRAAAAALVTPRVR